MLSPGDASSIGTFALEVFKAAREIFKDKEEGEKLFDPKQLVKAHQRLQKFILTNRQFMSDVKEADLDNIVYSEKYWNYRRDLCDLLENIAHINLNVVNIYSPSVASNMSWLVENDRVLHIHLFSRNKTSHITEIEELTTKHLYTIEQKAVSTLKKIDADSGDFISIATNLDRSLVAVEKELADFIRANWTSKDLS